MVTDTWSVHGKSLLGKGIRKRLTQKAGHVKTRLHLDPADAIGQHGLGVGMHHAVDARISFVYLAVDEALLVPLGHALLDG